MEENQVELDADCLAADIIRLTKEKAMLSAQLKKKDTVIEKQKNLIDEYKNTAEK